MIHGFETSKILLTFLNMTRKSKGTALCLAPPEHLRRLLEPLRSVSQGLAGMLLPCALLPCALLLNQDLRWPVSRKRLSADKIKST